jgi:hypothetical protein
MKKTLFLAAALLLSSALLYAGTESKMEKIFRETFPNAVNAKWIKDDNGYLVSFTQSGTLTRISYTNKGKFVSSLRYYQGKDLPTNVLMAVKNKYKGIDIFGVTEYSNNTEVIYFIKLYDGNNYFSAKAYSDGTVNDDETANSNSESEK